MNILVALFVFTIIIVIHELGHFLLAKKNAIFVSEFSMGMGPRLITLVRTAKGYRPRFFLSQHEFEHTVEWKDYTKYSWKLFPIGGSCMMLGEDELLEDNRAYNKKGVWARISVTTAGPIFNFLLAFIFALIITGMVGYDPAIVTVVEKTSPTEIAGLMIGDNIKEINGTNIDIGRGYYTYLQFHPLSDESLNVTYVRDGVKRKTTVIPEFIQTYLIGIDYDSKASTASVSIVEGSPLEKAGLKSGDDIVKVNDIKIKDGASLAAYMEENSFTNKDVSITYSRDDVFKTVIVTPVENVKYDIGISVNMNRIKTDFISALKYSGIEVKYWIVTTVQSLKQLINGRVSSDEMAGPVRIVNMIGNTYQSSKNEGFKSIFLNLSYICIVLSANLGVMNLLPIPALDGGRLVFLLLEVFRGKAVDQAKEGLVHMIGLVALMILMVFVLFNDLSNIF